MTKCEACGHFNPYWRTDWRDTEREFGRIDDVFPYNAPLEVRSRLKAKEVVVWNGFAWKMSDKFIRRIPSEIYNARGRWGLPYKAKDYYDATSRPSHLGKVVS